METPFRRDRGTAQIRARGMDIQKRGRAVALITARGIGIGAATARHMARTHRGLFVGRGTNDWERPEVSTSLSMQTLELGGCRSASAALDLCIRFDLQGLQLP